MEKLKKLKAKISGQNHEILGHANNPLANQPQIPDYKNGYPRPRYSMSNPKRDQKQEDKPPEGAEQLYQPQIPDYKKGYPKPPKDWLKKR